MIFLMLLLQLAMTSETPPPGVIGAKSSGTTGTSTNTPLGKTQQQCKHQLLHHHTAIVATEHTTQAAHLHMIRKTRSSKN
jgi:hypothetical protein